eukprot:3939165-Rhodomonas_salina.1
MLAGVHAAAAPNRTLALLSASRRHTMAVAYQSVQWQRAIKLQNGGGYRAVKWRTCGGLVRRRRQIPAAPAPPFRYRNRPIPC